MYVYILVYLFICLYACLLTRLSLSVYCKSVFLCVCLSVYVHEYKRELDRFYKIYEQLPPPTSMMQYLLRVRSTQLYVNQTKSQRDKQIERSVLIDQLDSDQ